MNKKLLFSTILLTLFGGITATATSCGGRVNTQDVVSTKYKLVADTSNIKKIFYEGDEFDPSGLIVRKVEIGTNKEGKVTKDYTLSIPAGQKLTLKDTTVEVIPNDKEIEGTSFTIGVAEKITIKRLSVTKLPNKIEYFVGETFDSTGIEVSINEILDGKVIKSTPTTDFKLSLVDGSILSEDNSEVMVISKTTGIKSTSFNITVSPKVVSKTLYEAVNELVTTNNYTVENKIGAKNKIKGLITANALIWESSQPAYFADHTQGPVGYGEYEGATYRFIPDRKTGEIKEARFISDLGGEAVDNGLFSEETYDSYGDVRISNYNIKGITEEDLNYLKTEAKAEPDNPNKYEIAIEHSKWLFNAIAHTTLTRNPVLHLDKGPNSGRVFIEILPKGLRVILQPPAIFGGVEGCEATISKVGETTIPNLDEFLKNPDFGYSNVDTLLTSTQKLLNANNYKITGQTNGVSVNFNNHYLYSEDDINVNSVFANRIKIDYGNVLSLIPGYYPFTLSNTKLEVNGEVQPVTIENIGYLKQISIFDNISKYFSKDPKEADTYTASIPLELQTKDLIDFSKVFLKDSVTGSKLNWQTVKLSINHVENKVNYLNLTFINGLETIDSVKIENFGTISVDAIEAAIQNDLYIK